MARAPWKGLLPTNTRLCWRILPFNGFGNAIPAADAPEPQGRSVRQRDRRRDDPRERVDFERLAQIVERPVPQRGARHLDVLIPAHDDDGEGRTVAAQVLEHLDPGHLRHQQVEQDDIGLKERHELQRLGAPDGDRHAVAELIWVLKPMPPGPVILADRL
jgi:hypothetical protein